MYGLTYIRLWTTRETRSAMIRRRETICRSGRTTEGIRGSTYGS